MWLMKTLLTSGCTNQLGAGHSKLTPYCSETAALRRLFLILQHSHTRLTFSLAELLGISLGKVQ
ncbi:hypothetical protein FMJ23_24860 [Klebsiella michiganensis]|nr:hypothetical protein [Klebsiella michiganensis]